MGLTGLSVIVTGIAAVIARRNHMQELRDLHRQAPAAPRRGHRCEQGDKHNGYADPGVD